MESAITVIIFLVDDSVSRGSICQRATRRKGGRRLVGLIGWRALASIYRQISSEGKSFLINREREKGEGKGSRDLDCDGVYNVT